MKRSSLGLASLAVMAAGLMAGGATVTTASNAPEARETRTSANPHTYTQERGSFSTSSTEFARGAWDRLRGTRRRRNGYGWTNAHAQRVARKARNVKRHRASKKG